LGKAQVSQDSKSLHDFALECVAFGRRALPTAQRLPSADSCRERRQILHGDFPSKHCLKTATNFLPLAKIGTPLDFISFPHAKGAPF